MKLYWIEFDDHSSLFRVKDDGYRALVSVVKQNEKGRWISDMFRHKYADATREEAKARVLIEVRF